MSMKLLDELKHLQEKCEKFLPESIRDDAFEIEYALTGIYNEVPKLNELQKLAGEVVLWTVEMFEAYEEGEI